MESNLIKIEDFELNELYKSFPGVITSIKVNLDYTEECLFISDNCETYFGYTADELIKNWDSFLNNINGQDKDYFKTDLKASKIAVFQDANPESAVAVFTTTPDMVLDYAFRIKMAKTGTVTVIADVGGKLHSVSKEIKVTIGGCGG